MSDPTSPYGSDPTGGPPPGGAPYGGAPYGGAPYGGAPYGGAPYATPYGAGPYGYGPPQYEHPQGTMVLVLGILGLVACQLLGPAAWIMGNRALEEIDAAPGTYSNRGTIQAGRICGIVSTVLMGFWLAFLALYLVGVVVLVGIG